jgi:intein/homing endonuclease
MPKIDEDLAEIIGIHIGDGCISQNKRYSEYYLGGDLTEEKEYHDKWVTPLFNKKIMMPLFKKKVKYKEHPKVGIYGFHIFNEKLVSFFKKLNMPSGSKKNIQIPKQIIINKELAKRFLRGLFDTDGSIYFHKNLSTRNPIHNRPVIKLGTVSEILICQVFDLLKNLGLHPRLKKPYKGKRDLNHIHTVLIYRKKDIEYFIEHVRFKNSKHITKWQLFKKSGYCPPYTTLKQRKKLLKKFI